MTTHKLSVDEGAGTPAELASGTGDYHAKAFCSCGWSESAWHHASDYDGSTVATYDAALEAGEDHIAYL